MTVTEEIPAEAAFAPADAVDTDVLYTVYLTSVDEVLEHVNAADTLGLGFRLESYVVVGEDSDVAGTEFEFALLNHMPTRAEEG